MAWRASAFVAFWVLLCAYAIATPFGEPFSSRSALVAIGIAAFSLAAVYLKRTVLSPDDRPGGFHNDVNWITFVSATVALAALHPNDMV